MKSSFDRTYREPDARTSTARPPARLPMLRVWLAGAGIFAVTIVGSALLLQAGYYIAGTVYAVLCGIILLFLCLSIDNRDAGAGSFIVGFVGLFIAVAMAIVGQDEVALFGSSARDVVAATAPASRATFLHFRDARVLFDRVGFADVIGGSQHQGEEVLYVLKVAPIVDAGWAEGRPIAALAVVGSPQLGHRTAEWRSPLNGGVALNRINVVERAKAARHLQRDEHLTIAPDAVFLRWSADPEGEAAAARRRLGIAYLIALAFWTVAVLVNGVVRAVRA